MSFAEGEYNTKDMVKLCIYLPFMVSKFKVLKVSLYLWVKK